MTTKKVARPLRVAATSGPLVPERIDALRDLIPAAFTEAGIAWDKLRTALGEAVDDRPDRYRFEWAGKRDAIRAASAAERGHAGPGAGGVGPLR